MQRLNLLCLILGVFSVFDREQTHQACELVFHAILFCYLKYIWFTIYTRNYKVKLGKQKSVYFAYYTTTFPKNGSMQKYVFKILHRNMREKY